MSICLEFEKALYTADDLLIETLDGPIALWSVCRDSAALDSSGRHPVG